MSVAQPDAPPALLGTNLRTHSCESLRIGDVGTEVKLCGWVQKARVYPQFVFVDLRDRYGITQCVIANTENGGDAKTYGTASKLKREFCIKIEGKVIERSNKNKDRSTGDVEIKVSSITVLSESLEPPMLIQDETDALEDTRLKFRFLDIRRNPVKNALILRNKITRAVRNYLGDQEFVEVETPSLIKSTPEGARDFVVPSRMNPGSFYALPQSPQTFKQILMVAGMDRYFQIVKCYRDEELRADRQPEFTQIDCEMSFVTQEDILSTFEKMMCHIFKSSINVDFPPFERMPFSVAMSEYGSDKPDIRFGMKLKDLTSIVKGKEFKVFDDAELVVGIVVENIIKYSKKKMKELEKLATSQLCGASGLVWVKVNNLETGDFQSTVNKFYTADDFKAWCAEAKAKTGDVLCIMAGPTLKTQNSLGSFRAEMGTRLGLRDKGYSAHWVVDFPMFEWDEDAKRYTAMHHPFTSPHPDDIHLLDTDPSLCRSYGYDMVINGVEVGGGSIRIHNKALQAKVFGLLGFTPEDAEEQFGFLMGAFQYGAPPHGGLAFGLDRLCTLIGGGSSIRDYIAFPKNKQGRDLMIQSPSFITPEQMAELKIDSTATAEDKKWAEYAWTVQEATSKKAKKKKDKKKKNKGSRHPGQGGHGGNQKQQSKQQEAPEPKVQEKKAE